MKIQIRNQLAAFFLLLPAATVMNSEFYWGYQGQLEAQQGIKGYAESPTAKIEANRRTRQTSLPPPRICVPKPRHLQESFHQASLTRYFSL